MLRAALISISRSSEQIIQPGCSPVDRTAVVDDKLSDRGIRIARQGVVRSDLARPPLAIAAPACSDGNCTVTLSASTMPS